MTPHVIVLGVTGLYLAICLGLGLWAGSRASNSTLGYVAGDRKIGVVLTYFITAATLFSAFAFLGAPGRAYEQGAAAFYILGYAAIGLVPLYFVGPRAARVGRVYGFVTQAEMVAFRFESGRLGTVMAVVSVAAFIPYLALQMKGAGYVLERCSDGAIPPWLGALVVYAVVGTYVLRSGVLGVGWTNTFQGIFMMIVAWGLGIYLPTALHGGVQPMFEKLAMTDPALLVPPGNDGHGGRWGWGAYSSAVIVSAVGASLWPHTFMRVFSAKDPQTIRITILLWPLFSLFMVPLLVIGMAGIGFEPAPPRPDQILPHLLMNMDISPIIVGLFCAGALAASMSSGDAMAHAAASIAIRDVVVRGFGLSLNTTVERAYIRMSVVVVLVTAYVTAVAYEGSLVNLLLATFGAIVQFAPAILLALYDRRARATEILWGMTLGTAVTLMLMVWPTLRPADLHPGLYGLLANIGIIVLSRLMFSNEVDDPIRRSKAAEAFVTAAAGVER